MRLAVLADIHGNLPAIEAVVDDIGRRAVDQVVNLGDCASGPLWPRETLAGLIALQWPTVRGNHDRILGRDRPEKMAPSDRYAHAETESAQRTWLTLLPPALDIGDGVVAFHARPGDDDAYLLEDVVDGRLAAARPAAVAERLGGVAGTIILTGHSHLPSLVRLDDGRTIINPGSVGQPRDSDPRACYAILDTELNTWEYRRVEYDIEATQERMRKHNMPSRLVNRLAYGW